MPPGTEDDLLMSNRVLEAQFEDQIEELKDRLHDCLHAPTGTDAVIARGILEGLIAGYQEQLALMRQLRLTRSLATSD